MYQKYNKYRVLQALFDRPTTGLHLREIAKEATLAPYSTKPRLAGRGARIMEDQLHEE